MKALTRTQNELLEKATQHEEGEVNMYGVQMKTLRNLAGAGLIREEPKSTDVIGIQASIELFVEQATKLLAGGDWHGALTSLERALDKEEQLKTTVWRITEEGRSVVRGNQAVKGGGA